MHNHTTQRALILALFTLVLLFIVPGSQSAQAAPNHALDDAYLLMIAGQSRIYDYYSNQEVSFHAPGHAVLSASAVAQGASRGEINEQKMLADLYQGWADQATDDSTIRQHLQQKANAHQDQAEELAKARRRYLRRHNNIFRRAGRAIATPVAKVGQAVVKGSRWAFRGIGKFGRVVVTIAKEELIIRAKEIVRAKIADLTDIMSGRIDMVVNRLARKFGMPAAELFREFIINPAFKRLRGQLERNVDKLLGEQQDQPASAGGDESAADDDYEPDFSNVDETGDTDYDDDTDSGSAPVDETGETGYDDDAGRYPVETWFDAENIQAACKSMVPSEFASLPMQGANLTDYEEGYTVDGKRYVDRHIEVYCDFRSAELEGLFFYVDILDTEEAATTRFVDPGWENYCLNSYDYPWGRTQCGPHELLETQDRVDENGDVIPEILYVRLTTRDENAWVSITLDPTRREGGIPRADAIADSIHAVLEAKRGQ